MSWSSMGETLHLHELCLGFFIYFFLGCPSEWEDVLRSESDLVQPTSQGSALRSHQATCKVLETHKVFWSSDSMVRFLGLSCRAGTQ